MIVYSKIKKYVWTLALFFVADIPSAFAQGGIIQGNSGSSGWGGGLRNPLQNINSLEEFVVALLRIVINIGFPILILFIVYSGFLFVTAQGSEEKLKKAKTTFFWTIVGAAVFLGSWVLAIIIENTVKLITG